MSGVSPTVSNMDLARIRLAVSWAFDTLDERAREDYSSGDVLALSMHYLGYPLFTGRSGDEQPTGEWMYAIAQLAYHGGDRSRPPAPSQHDVSLPSASRISALTEEILNRRQLTHRMRHLSSISRGVLRDRR